MPRICHSFAAFAFVTASVLCLPVAQAQEDDGVQALIAKVQPSIATIRVSGRDGDQLQMGTGFVVDSIGLIATNFHVIGEGRRFTVELSSGRKLPVTAIEASDRNSDLAIVRVDPGDKPLEALPMSGSESVEQGLPILAFGNPLGLRNSVVQGIVSAVREMDGRQMIQVAMPIEPGNSGGPIVDRDGKVLGIVNMKSAVESNIGFAIPVNQLRALQEKPNPVDIDRWVRLGGINEQLWTPLLGSKWQNRGGLISARGPGESFGGRSLCLSTLDEPKRPYEIAVNVRLDDESGAAGLAFCSDGKDRHYGFYPTAGKLRLTCFKGPTVYAWQILQDIDSPHYLPGQWNRLRVRIEENRFQCFLNEQLVLESTDQQLTSGRIGLVKFRDTEPDFKNFRIGSDLQMEPLTEEARKWLTDLQDQPALVDGLSATSLGDVGDVGESATRELLHQAQQLERQAQRIRQLAADAQTAPVLEKLRALFADAESANTDTDRERLLTGALLIAALDDADVDVEAYLARVEEMATEIAEQFEQDADPLQRRAALDQFLFKENGFHGGRAEYYHPANSHLNRVIDDREGLPITLSILYMELGRRIGLTIDGIGLPGHFVVNDVTDPQAPQLIDVFDRGTPMSREEAQTLVLAGYGRPLTEEDLKPQTSTAILTRVLRNLIGVAGQNEDGEAICRYVEATVALNPDSLEYRVMRAQIRGMTGRTIEALEDVDWLLSKDRPELDHAAVSRLRDALLERQR